MILHIISYHIISLHIIAFDVDVDVDDVVELVFLGQ